MIQSVKFWKGEGAACWDVGTLGLVLKKIVRGISDLFAAAEASLLFSVAATARRHYERRSMDQLARDAN